MVKSGSVGKVTQRKSDSSGKFCTGFSSTVAFLSGRFEVVPHPLDRAQQYRPLFFDVLRAAVEMGVRELQGLCV